MSFTVSKTDHLTIVGDSLSTDFLAPNDAWWKNPGFTIGIQSNFGNYAPVRRNYYPTSGTLPAPSLYPTFSVNGLAGRAITDVSPAIMTFVDAGSTKVIIQLGVNDAALGTSIPTLTTAINKIKADLATGGINSFLWVGPFSHGEHWPSGAGSGNDIDVAIDAIDALLASLIAGYGNGYDYVSWRQLIFNIYEPLRNPLNAISGVFTNDGTHVRAVDIVGHALAAGAVRNKIVLV